MPADRVLHVSIHDAAPPHAQRLERLLDLFDKEGASLPTLLVVPDFHRKAPLVDHPEFCARLRALRLAGHELALHGLYHLEDSPGRPSRLWTRTGLLRRFATAGEGEFLDLPPEQVAHRIDLGLDAWNNAQLGPFPRGFVPPAWLHRGRLDAPLRERGIWWWENHHAILQTGGAPDVLAPVVTWATRDAVRRLGSLAVCPVLVRRARLAPVLRLAVHPHDADHPATMSSIRRGVRLARNQGRRTVPVWQILDLPEN